MCRVKNVRVKNVWVKNVRVKNDLIPFGGNGNGKSIKDMHYKKTEMKKHREDSFIEFIRYIYGISVKVYV